MTLPFKALIMSAGLLTISAVAGAQPRPPHHPVHHRHHHRVHHPVHHRPHHPLPPHR